MKANFNGYDDCGNATWKLETNEVLDDWAMAAKYGIGFGIGQGASITLPEVVSFEPIGEFIDGRGYFSTITLSNGHQRNGYAWQNPNGKIIVE